MNQMGAIQYDENHNQQGGQQGRTLQQQAPAPEEIPREDRLPFEEECDGKIRFVRGYN